MNLQHCVIVWLAAEKLERDMIIMFWELECRLFLSFFVSDVVIR